MGPATPAPKATPYNVANSARRDGGAQVHVVFGEVAGTGWIIPVMVPTMPKLRAPAWRGAPSWTPQAANAKARRGLRAVKAVGRWQPSGARLEHQLDHAGEWRSKLAALGQGDGLRALALSPELGQLCTRCSSRAGGGRGHRAQVQGGSPEVQMNVLQGGQRTGRRHRAPRRRSHRGPSRPHAESNAEIASECRAAHRIRTRSTNASPIRVQLICISRPSQGVPILTVAALRVSARTVGSDSISSTSS